MRKRFERIASLISAIVTGIETLVLIAIIIGQALLLERSNRAQLLEIGLNASILLVSLVTFILSIFALKRAKGDYLSAYKNRRLIYAVMAFDYLLAFLFFTYCLIEKNILVVLYVLCLILLMIAGSLYLYEVNQYFKNKNAGNLTKKEEEIETK